MKTIRILTLFTALLVSVLLTAQTSVQRTDVQKQDQAKISWQMMKYVMQSSPFALLSTDNPADRPGRCYKKQEVERLKNRDPRVDYRRCYPVNNYDNPFSTRPVIKSEYRSYKNEVVNTDDR